MAVLLATLAAVVYGVADYCGGRASRSASSTAVTFWAEASGIVVLLIVLPILGDPVPGGADLWWGVATAAAASVGLVCFYRALSAGAMTVVAPVTAVVSAVIPVGVGLAQGERPGGVSLAGCAAAAVAIALVSGAGGHPAVRPSTGVLSLAVVAGVGFALVFIFLDATSPEAGMWPVAVARVASLPMIASAGAVLRSPLRLPRAIWALVFVGGLCDISANLLYLESTGHGLLAVVAVLTALYPVTTVTLAFVLDDERLSRAQTVGLVLAVTALVLVGLGEAGGHDDAQATPNAIRSASATIP